MNKALFLAPKDPSLYELRAQAYMRSCDFKCASASLACVCCLSFAK